MNRSRRALLCYLLLGAACFAPNPASASPDRCGSPPARAGVAQLERAGRCEADAVRNSAAIGLFRRALAAVPPADRATLARLSGELAEALDRRGDSDKADLAYRRAYAEAQRAYPAGDPRLARYVRYEALADEDLLRYAQAGRELQAARGLAQRGGAAFRGDRAEIEYTYGTLLETLKTPQAAAPQVQLALADARAAFPSGNSLIVRILQSLAGEYSRARDNERAIQAAFAAMREEIGRAPGLSSLAGDLEAAGRAYHADHSAAALARAEAAYAKLVRFGTQREETVATDMLTLTDVYGRFHDYRLALDAAQAAVDIDTAYYGTNAPEWANSERNLFWAQLDVYDYSGAERSIREVLRVDRAAFGERSAAAASDYQALGTVYEYETALPQARFYYDLELSIVRGLKPYRPGRISTALLDAGDADNDLGNSAAAEREYTEAFEMRRKAYGDDLPFLATPLDKRGLAYLDEGQSGPALEDFQRVLAMRLASYGPHDALVADTYRHLARAEMQGDAAAKLRALGYIRKALDIDIALWGPNDLAVGDKPDGSWRIEIKRNHMADMSLVSLLSEVGKLYASEDSDRARTIAGSLYRAALQIADEHSDDVGTVALIWLRLERLHEHDKDYVAAEADIRAALAACKSAPDYDTSPLYSVLARALRFEKKTDEADAATGEARRIATARLGPNSIYAEYVVETAAWQEFRTGRYDLAREDYRSSLEVVQRQIDDSLPFSNESERLAHLDALEPVYERFYSAVLANAAHDPRLGGDMYDAVLRTRGLVAESMESVRAKVLSSGDARARADLARLRLLDTELAAGQLSAPEGGAPHLDAEYASLARQAGELETDLVGRVAALQAIGNERSRPARWQDVRAALRPGEAAVEIVRYDEWSETGWTGKSRYAALILTAAAQWPAVVDLGDAAPIENQAQIGYDAFVGIDSNRHAFQASLYGDVWQPIAAAIGPATRIYLVPDGSLNRVAFGAIPRPDGSLLGDAYDIRVLWSTKDLLQRNTAPQPKVRDAVVIGDPRFDLSESAQRAALAGHPPTDAPTSGGATGESLRSAGPRGSLLPSLDYTRAEADDVAGLLAGGGFRSVKKYVGPSALEEQLKLVRHPSILHIATHGFYVPDSDDDWSSAPSDALMRSGLLFAGADRLWADGRTSNNVENGVFTGLEATGLDLFGTDLVVLSACGTGLGDVRFGEGVFGLTRAFHEAGARSMLVSLWKVDDSYTEELMRRFYGYLLDGKEKHDALKLAQHDVRADVIHDFGADVPWLWAGFVLIGA